MRPALSARFAALAALALVASGCLVNRAEHDGVAFLDVKLVTPDAAGRGTPEAPLDTPRGAFKVKVSVRALDRAGQPMDCEAGHGCFEGKVSFAVTPGWLPVPNPLNSDADPENDDDKRPLVPAARGDVTLQLAKGAGEKELDLRGVFETVHVWAEEWPDEAAEKPKSRYVAGVSEPLYFKLPSIQDVQFDPQTMGPTCKANRLCDNTTSPLVDNFVETRESRYLVTGVTNDGFFVSDLSEETSPKIEGCGGAKPSGTDKAYCPGRFESLFVYNFSYPEDLYVGDVVTRLSGTVQEFTGDTQVTFPDWVKEDPAITAKDRFGTLCESAADCAAGFLCQAGFCRITPTAIDEELCDRETSQTGAQNLCGHSARNIHLESLESARVELPVAYMPTHFANCDFNGDGDVPNQTPTTDCPPKSECACKLDCIAQDGCSELSALHTYGQYAVTIDGPRKFKINVITRDSSPTVDPTLPAQEDAPTQPLVYGNVRIRVRGNLRQSLPARPRWTIVAGEKADFCCLPATPADASRCREIPLCEDVP